VSNQLAASAGRTNVLVDDTDSFDSLDSLVLRAIAEVKQEVERGVLDAIKVAIVPNRISDRNRRIMR
jgi:hypothetical protein